MEGEIIKYKQDVSTNEIQLKEARKNAEGKTKVDVESLRGICEKQEEKVEKLRGKKSELTNRMENNSEKRDKMSAQQEALEKARKENVISERLYKLVRGNTGNGKITLEQYI